MPRALLIHPGPTGSGSCGVTCSTLRPVGSQPIGIVFVHQVPRLACGRGRVVIGGAVCRGAATASKVPGSNACDALSFAAAKSGVVGCVTVPGWAFRFGSGDCRERQWGSPKILAMRDRFKMLGVHASPVPAKMVDVEPVRDRPLGDRVAEPVTGDRAPHAVRHLHAEYRVPSSGEVSAGPCPASGFGGNRLGIEPSDILGSDRVRHTPRV